MRPRQNSLTHPRGRLPARVYWVRRSLVVLTAAALVFGFAQLLGGVGGGAGDDNDTARLAADRDTAPSSTSTQPRWPDTPSVRLGTPKSSDSTTAKKPQKSPSATLAAPDGPCSPDDISVAPSVTHAYALRPVIIKLRLSGASPACTFEVSAKTVAVKITSGSDYIWSTQDCPQGIKEQTVVVRSGQETTVPVTWGGHRAQGGDCSISNPWADTGYYHALAAVLGSTPADTQFKLTVAPAEVITKTAHPHPKKAQKSTKDDAASHSGQAQESGGSDQDGAKGKGSACGGDNAASSC